YSYGRYAGTNEEWHGINTLSNGPGVLLRLTGEDAQSYNQDKFNKTGATVFQILDASDEGVQKVFDQLFDSSGELPSNGEYKDNENARIVSEYKLLSNNCTTIVCEVLNEVGSRATESLADKSGTKRKNTFVIP